MRNNKLLASIFLLLALWMGVGSIASAQVGDTALIGLHRINFNVQEDNFTGFDDGSERKLNKAVESINEAIQAIGTTVDFKAYDLGQYRVAYVTDESKIQEYLATVQSQAAYYIVLTKLWKNGQHLDDLKLYCRLPMTVPALAQGNTTEVVQGIGTEFIKQEYQLMSNDPTHVMNAMAKGLKRWKEYLFDPTNPQNAPPVNYIKNYFENEVCSIKIPIWIKSNPARPDSIANRMSELVENHTGKEVRFIDAEDYGLLSTVLNTVLNSSLFTDLPDANKGGFITDNNYFLSSPDAFENTKTAYNNTTKKVALWAHVYEGYNEPACLYVVARNLDRESLCYNGVNGVKKVDVLEELQASFNVSSAGYNGSKFEQSASVVFLAATTTSLTNTNEYSTSNQSNTSSYLELLCSGATNQTMNFLSPAGNPIQIKKGTIPLFDPESANKWNFDHHAVISFTDGTGRWKGYGSKSLNKFLGYRQYALGNNTLANIGTQSTYLVWLGNRVGNDINLVLNNYTPPTNRQPTPNAEGAFLNPFNGLTPPAIPSNTVYTIDIPVVDIKALNLALYAALASPPNKYNGTLIKVPKVDAPTQYNYYLCQFNGEVNVWKRFSCEIGQWEVIENPFLTNGGNIDLFASKSGRVVVNSPTFNIWLNTLPNNFTHQVLDDAGLVPFVGEVFDVANGFIYYLEGNTKGAVLCSFSAIPLIGNVVGGMRQCIKIADNLPQGLQATIAKIGTATSPTTIEHVKSVGNELVRTTVNLENIIVDAKKYTNNAEFNELLLDALSSEAKFVTLGKALSDNPRLIESWVYLKRGNVPEADRLDVDLLKALDHDLHSSSRQVSLRQLLNQNPADISIWKELNNDAAYYHELKKDNNLPTDLRWLAWGNSEFFIQVTQLGKKFETETVLDAFRTVTKDAAGNILTSVRNLQNADYIKLKSRVGKPLDEYNMYSQLQLSFVPNPTNPNVTYFVADQVFVKWGKVNGFDEIIDVVIVENKLSASTALTVNQNIAKSKTTLKVRTVTPSIESLNTSGGTVVNLAQDMSLVQPTWVKAYDGGNATIITDFTTTF
jgi:hypothetical protein